MAPFPIVGIGASAGGLEAFEQFFLHLPPDIGMAFVLVSHLDPTHASLLTEILQRFTAMPVVEAEDQMKVKPNCVYVIPPNRDMAIFHGMLQLSELDQPRGLRMPIDAFLRSLAEDQGENTIGIVLSGTGTDGTLGLRAILGAGGITLVQTPATAKFDGMPASAIQSGYATHVLTVDKMTGVLQAALRARAPHPGIVSPPTVTGSINQIMALLRSGTGHDFSLYKKSTIGRRIERRMLQHNIEDTNVYVRYLKEHPVEVHTLFKELLINVTSFFRDSEAFILLKQDILPHLLTNKPEDYIFRVWVAGCATGEEAYSIAILLREFMNENNQGVKVQLYATDLDDDAITLARAGLYPPNIAQDVTPERLRRFFTKEVAGYRVKKEIREMLVFAVQNIIKAPPFTRLDLLCCRNLMIYLEPELQNRLIPAFHYALKPGGVLFLSPSESIGNHHALFSALNRKWKFYQAIASAASTRVLIAGGLNLATDTHDKTQKAVLPKTRESNIAELTRRMLIQSFAPPSVLTNQKGDILYVQGDTGRYLRPAPGQASLNVVEMAREGLQPDLRAAIQSATSKNMPTLNHEMLVKTNGGFSTVSLSVRLLPDMNTGQLMLLISFQDVAQPASAKMGRTRRSKPAEQQRIAELEHELAYTRENLQTTIEEQQASNEELKSTNEELQSANEELQSTNEELETSKEELQSVNEELITVNTELQSKIEQLAGMQNDMKNLLDNINVGTIFLDHHLVIKRFTREATQIYRLAESDKGRPLSDIKSNFPNEDLLSETQRVLDSLVPIEREMRTSDGTWFLARIRPYRTVDNMIDGVVLTFTDITERILSITEREARDLAEAIVDTVREPLVVLNRSLQVVSASRPFYRIFQMMPEKTVGLPIYELGDNQWNIPAMRSLLENILPNNQSFEGYALEYDLPGIGRRAMQLNARRITGKMGDTQLILLVMEMLASNE